MVFPNSVVLELTYNCNHACKFCSCPWYSEKGNYNKGEELSFNQWKFAIDKLCDIGVRHFSISGGECLLKDCLHDILRYIDYKYSTLNISEGIVLISNGLLMSEEHIKVFKETGVNLSMSMPGYESFEYHTGHNNANGILHWFEVAKRYGLYTTLNVTVTKKNIYELYETLALGILHGASSILINRFLPGGRGLQYEKDLLLSTAQLNEMLDITEEVLSECNRQGFVGTEFPKCIIKDIDKYKHINIGTYCAAAKGFFVIGPSGEVRVCNHSPRIVGNILYDNIIEDDSYWNIFSESNYHPSICDNCMERPICDCGCREVSNILNGNPCDVEPSLNGFVKSL